MSGIENNTTAPEENKMSLSEALNMLINLRNACNFLGLQEYVTVLEAIIDKVLTDSNSL
ncbi:MAG: hypothetical protein K2O65_14450 [Lachnospiraceae bacterium]|nr:hypothetical protein [Lachnospiraceae bacterium]